MPATTQREVVLDIQGMTCASCVRKVERALTDVGDVREASVNLANRTATVHTSSDELEPLLDAVRGVGYGASPHRHDRSPAEEVRAYGIRLLVAIAFTLPLLVVTFVMPDLERGMELAWVLATPVVFYAGWPFHRAAVRAALHRTTTMDTLISIGSLAAYGYSVWSVVAGGEDHYFDTAAVIVTLILVGKVLEARARMSATDASRALLERGAKDATLLEDGVERPISVDDLLPGSIVVVRPGEKIPADGVVREGRSWVDLSLLTGESVPADVGPGDEVVGASINGNGRIVVFVTAVGPNTKLAEIVRLLERAQGSKAPIQRLADRVSSVFVPVVLALAALTFLGWFAADPSSPGAALLHAVAVVLIACPCALGLATPAAIMSGTGRAAELGILFKGGAVFERARAADVVLLDKTGTVTGGVMTLADVVPANGHGRDEVLALAAAAESGSEHPIASAVTRAAVEGGIAVPPVRDQEVRPGAGAIATIDDTIVRVGRPEDLPADLAATTDRLAALGRTPFAVWRGDEPVGVVSVADAPRPDAAAAIARMHGLGLEVAMVTGDRASTAEVIAAKTGIDRVLAEVLPADKVREVERLQGDGHTVVFVGDGINDAPALARADVGLAMGTGTDVAIAAADVNLLGGSLASAADALVLTRRTYRVIAQNLFWAFAYNIVMIPLAVFGVLNPAWAAAAMALSSVTVVLNALRLRRFAPGARA